MTESPLVEAERPSSGPIISSLSEDGLSANDVNSLLASVQYVNSSENPNTGDRKIVFEIADLEGKTSTSVEKTIQILPDNDAPTLFVKQGDANVTEIYGEQLILEGDASKVASKISVKDVDSKFLARAEISLGDAPVVGGSLGLSTAGEKLISAFELVKATGDDGTLTITGAEEAP